MSHREKIDSQNLLKSYLEICNQALQENKDIFPYKSIFDAVQKKVDGKKIALSIIDDEPKMVCCLSLEKDKIKLLPLELDKSVNICHLKISYLKNVLSHPQEYITNPTKIDWRWIENIINKSD